MSFILADIIGKNKLDKRIVYSIPLSFMPLFLRVIAPIYIQQLIYQQIIRYGFFLQRSDFLRGRNALPPDCFLLLTGTKHYSIWPGIDKYFQPNFFVGVAKYPYRPVGNALQVHNLQKCYYCCQNVIQGPRKCTVGTPSSENSFFLGEVIFYAEGCSVSTSYFLKPQEGKWEIQRNTYFQYQNLYRCLNFCLLFKSLVNPRYAAF